MKKTSSDIQPEIPGSAPLKLKICGSLFVFSAFLLPLKWGTLASMSEAAGFFPEAWIDYWHITWAAHSFGLWSAILLLLALICTGTAVSGKTPARFALLWGCGMLLAVLPGVFSPGAEPNFAFTEFANFAGIAAWTLAVWHLHSAAPQWTRRMAAAFMLGVLITAVNGFYQYFFGFEVMKEFLQSQIEAGIQVPEAIQIKLTDTRITSFMASPNALAGVLLITLFPVFFYGGKWGKLFEPAKISIALFRGCGLILLGGALILCRSRSVFIALTAAGALAVFSAPFIKRKFKIFAAVGVALLLLTGAVFALKFGRGFGSIAERADYLRTSAVLTREHPFCGAGWGGFFFRHMEMKFSTTDEAARDPHNIVAAFAGQSGVLSGLIVLTALLLPLAVLWKERFSGNWKCMVFWSGVLFTIHILMDCDMHIPAIMAGMITLYFSASDLPPQGVDKRWKLPVFILGIAVAAVSMWSNFRTLEGEYRLSEFMEFLNPSTVESRNNFAGLPMEKFEGQAAAVRPELALIPELAGDWFFSRGELEQAEQRYLKAKQLEPRRPGIYRRLARIACAKGDFEFGLELLKQAQKMFPRNPKYSINEPENRAMFPAGFLEGKDKQ